MSNILKRTRFIINSRDRVKSSYKIINIYPNCNVYPIINTNTLFINTQSDNLFENKLMIKNLNGISQILNLKILSNNYNIYLEPNLLFQQNSYIYIKTLQQDFYLNQQLNGYHLLYFDNDQPYFQIDIKPSQSQIIMANISYEYIGGIDINLINDQVLQPLKIINKGILVEQQYAFTSGYKIDELTTISENREAQLFGIDIQTGYSSTNDYIYNLDKAVNNVIGIEVESIILPISEPNIIANGAKTNNIFNLSMIINKTATLYQINIPQNKYTSKQLEKTLTSLVKKATNMRPKIKINDIKCSMSIWNTYTGDNIGTLNGTNYIITQINHIMQIGDYVVLENFGGIKDGKYRVSAVNDNNSYNIELNGILPNINSGNGNKIQYAMQIYIQYNNFAKYLGFTDEKEILHKKKLVSSNNPMKIPYHSIYLCTKLMNNITYKISNTLAEIALINGNNNGYPITKKIKQIKNEIIPNLNQVSKIDIKLMDPNGELYETNGEDHTIIISLISK